MPAGTIVIVGSFVLLLQLLAVGIIDLRRMIIPDLLNTMLAASGLVYQCLVGADAVLYLGSSGTVFLSFWLVRTIHARLSGRIGLGLGDVKFLAAAAMWVSPPQLPVLLLVASTTALFFVAGRMALSGHDTIHQRVPFGPFLSFGLAIAWVYERSIDLGVIR